MGSAGTVAGLAVLAALAIAAPAQAASGAFERAWGKNVAGGGVFGICTVAASCLAGTAGGPGGQFNHPAYVATDGAGNVYVADQDNARIQKFDSNGNFQRAWGKNVAGGGVFGICTVAASCQAGASGGLAGELSNPSGLATDGAGNLYVADAGNNRIQKFDTSGNFQRAWGRNVDSVASGTEAEICTAAAACQAGTVGVEGGEFDNPSGLARDGAGHVYVADSGSDRIQRFDSDGNFQRAWGKEVDSVGGLDICTVASNCQAGTTSALGGAFNFPTSVATDGTSNVYVADQSNNRIQRFDSDGNLQQAWGTAGTQGGKFSFPQTVATDGAGNVYVADTGNVRIQKFDSVGNFQRAWGKNVAGDGVFGICTGAASCQAGTSGGGLGGEFAFPTGVAADGAGNLYVADQSNHRIQRFGDPIPPGPPPPAPDTTDPVLSALAQSNSSWAVDSKGGAETQAAKRKRKPKKGTTFSYRLSEAGRVVFTIERKTTGRRVKGKCVKQTRKNRKRPKCTLFKKAGSFAQQGRAGQNSKTFSGKIGSTKLKPGSYRATLVAKDAAGNASKPASLNFKVVRG